jgi:hypothetical protein
MSTLPQFLNTSHDYLGLAASPGFSGAQPLSAQGSRLESLGYTLVLASFALMLLAGLARG